jgi:hypothetical protein
MILFLLGCKPFCIYNGIHKYICGGKLEVVPESDSKSHSIAKKSYCIALIMPAYNATEKLHNMFSLPRSVIVAQSSGESDQDLEYRYIMET